MRLVNGFFAFVCLSLIGMALTGRYDYRNVLLWVPGYIVACHLDWFLSFKLARSTGFIGGIVLALVGFVPCYFSVLIIPILLFLIFGMHVSANYPMIPMQFTTAVNFLLVCDAFYCVWQIGKSLPQSMQIKIAPKKKIEIR